VVVVPVAAHIEPACEAALVEVAQRGYAVRRVYGYYQHGNAGSRKLWRHDSQFRFERFRWHAYRGVSVN
jgi:hypothetical protein